MLSGFRERFRQRRDAEGPLKGLEGELFKKILPQPSQWRLVRWSYPTFSEVLLGARHSSKHFIGKFIPFLKQLRGHI